MRRSVVIPAAMLMFLASWGQRPAQGGVATYTDFSSWQTAATAASTEIRLVDFSGFANQTQVGGVNFGPGMAVRAYADSPGLYPRVDNDSAYGNGWLVNRNH
ncbi:MAG TPA: hypothetical protein VG722_03715, partial [Tepidisphaeraceae bacterium]|nr:hypothetical protein [Tepidisphaeraceae bacterium]